MALRIFAVLRAMFFSVLFVSVWTWFFPRWIAASKAVPFEARPNVIAIVLMAIGAALMLRCTWDFGWNGRGTPAPFDPPRRLVVNGPYRWVRNPMYVGLVVFLVGEALLVPSITREILILAAAWWTMITAVIVLYEEPTLRRLFDGDYVDYCANVRRWLPRLTPFDKNSGAAVPSADLD